MAAIFFSGQATTFGAVEPGVCFATELREKTYIGLKVRDAAGAGDACVMLGPDAGEGPRAQTYEHLEILRLLGVERGVVALTKIDAVEPERMPDVSGLVPDAEVVPVSATTGEGLDELRSALDRAAADRARPDGPARLYVDRVFSLPGAGTVATGTLWSAASATNDELAPFSNSRRTR